MKCTWVRSTTMDIYTQRLIRERYVDQMDFPRETPPSIGVNRYTGVRIIRCKDSLVATSGFGTPKPKPNRCDDLLNKPHALLSPVSDPTTTTKKVRTVLNLSDQIINFIMHVGKIERLRISQYVGSIISFNYPVFNNHEKYIYIFHQ